MSLTKSDVIRQVNQLGYSKKDSTEIVETILEIIKQSLVINDNYFFPLTTIRIPVCHNL